MQLQPVWRVHGSRNGIPTFISGGGKIYMQQTIRCVQGVERSEMCLMPTTYGTLQIKNGQKRVTRRMQ